MGQYTREELQKFREDIDRYYSQRKLFLGLGWACMGSGLLLMVISIAVAISGANTVIFAYLSSMLLGGGIVLFILRRARYNQRIKNRKRILQQAKEEHEIDQIFEKNNDDK